MEEEKKDNFDELPLEIQMRVLQVERNCADLAKNFKELGERDNRFEAVLECARELKDAKLLNHVLFSGAEYFEKLEPLPPDGHEYDAVKSKILDWLRHVLNEAPDRMRFAVAAIDHLKTGRFDGARRKFDRVRIREDEFKAIEDNYKEALA